MNTFAEMPLHYSVRRSPRAKKTRIVVTADKIEVVAPPQVPERRIQAFVDAQQGWIRDAVKRVGDRPEAHSRLAPSRYFDGVLVPYQGKHYSLCVKPTSARSIKIILQPEALWIYLPVTVDNADRSDAIRQALQCWMKQQARQLAIQLINKHAGRFALTPRSLRIKTQKSRWGSCGPQNDINLNWLLMLAPPVVMEYVVIHELCHIKHKNHSKAFWSLVAEHMPDYLQHRSWLKQHGAGLMRGL